MAWKTENIPAHARGDRPVEQATAAPGEKRNVRRCRYLSVYTDQQCALPMGHDGPHLITEDAAGV